DRTDALAAAPSLAAVVRPQSPRDPTRFPFSPPPLHFAPAAGRGILLATGSHTHAYPEGTLMAASGPVGKAVLIIDDNQVEREGLAAILQKEGYSVFLAEDGAVALGMLQAGLKADAILMDVLLPRMDGWDFLRELR